ncbi:hypothetical protein [Pararhodospirillum photometricum]|uniref:Uncharacterized protein n=1 Tax=Pararhodospirillum photometricum DSM 122 TaxID=1150469 RepID=H6SRJ4_PARPM|nr:hypothetical protein [Pararhodospirillum photometricum]CCG07523.1 Putative uncharacterized protein [Pararhodospirillum photometricum DSM 122]
MGATDPTGLAPPTALGPTPSAQPPASATMAPPTSASPVILARFASLAEWVEIRRRLQGLPGGGAMALQAVSRDQAQFILPWSGSLPDLQAQMQSRGLSLTKRDGMWVLEAQGAAVPGMAPR